MNLLATSRSFLCECYFARVFWLVTQSRGVVCGCVARVASGSVESRAYPSHHRELVEVTKCTRISVGHIIVKIL